MLDSLPPEIIEHIIAHLPTASSIIHVARLNKKLYSIVSADDYALFREFLQRAFPSIKTAPPWRDVTRLLTSRSRAWDRKSFIARECYPDDDNSSSNAGGHRYISSSKFGFVPAIDSYETWSSSTPTGQKQVLAFGAAGRLMIRTTEKGQTHWKSYRQPEDFVAHNDIVNLRLLRPHQHENAHGEVVVYRRANGLIEKAESGVGEDSLVPTTRYFPEGNAVDCLDVSSSAEPLMAICNANTVQLFSVNTKSARVRPSSVLSLRHDFEFRHRKRCVKFLDSHRIATSIQYVEGRQASPIMIYDVHPTGALVSPFEPSININLDEGIKGRHCANTLAPLDNTASLASRPNQVFLSGWTDGVTRLHDLRTPSQLVSQYVDSVDDGQILSLSAIGHERFFAGSHQNACLKVFDLRMSGAHVYSYLDALPPKPKPKPQPQPQLKPPTTHSSPPRGINIFLAVTVGRERLWSPLPRHPNSTRHSRYRGSIYTLSSPSPYSPTLFAGIESHVIQLDFLNTDDILRGRGGGNLSKTLTQKPAIDDVLNLSCYERPREGREMSDNVLLRKQTDWHETVRGFKDGQQVGNLGVGEDGWDCRWTLTTAWRRGDGGTDVSDGGGGGSSVGAGAGAGAGRARRWH